MRWTEGWGPAAGAAWAWASAALVCTALAMMCKVWPGVIVLMALVTGTYTILGGLKSVAYTEAMQTVVLVLGSMSLAWAQPAAPEERVAALKQSLAVTGSVVNALGLGLATSVPGRSALLDGFGLIALASLFPMITVMGYAQISHWLSGRNEAAGTSPPQGEDK